MLSYPQAKWPRGWEVSINAEGVNVSLRTNDGHHVVLGSCIYGNVGWCYSVPCGLAASLRDGSRLGRELNRGGDAAGVHGGAGWLREPLDGAPESGSLEQSLEHRDLEVTSLAEGEQRLGQSGGPRQGDSAAGGHQQDALNRGGGDSCGLREGRSRDDQGAPAVHHAEGGGSHPGVRGEGEWIDGSRRVGPAWVATSEATTESEGGPSREDPRPERAAANPKESGWVNHRLPTPPRAPRQRSRSPPKRRDHRL